MKRNWKDVAGGGLFALLGLYVIATAFAFGIGSPRRMDAGFYPLMLGVAAVVLGLAVAAAGLREPAAAPRIAWKPFGAVIAGLVAFYVLIDRGGLLPAIWALVGLASLADEDIRAWEAGVLAFVISVAAWLLFAVALEMPVAGIEGVL